MVFFASAVPFSKEKVWAVLHNLQHPTLRAYFNNWRKFVEIHPTLRATFEVKVPGLRNKVFYATQYEVGISAYCTIWSLSSAWHMAHDTP